MKLNYAWYGQTPPKLIWNAITVLFSLNKYINLQSEHDLWWQKKVFEKDTREEYKITIRNACIHLLWKHKQNFPIIMYTI